MKKLLAEVNISEGKDTQLIDAVKDALLREGELSLIDLKSDADHNRTVFSYVGAPGDVLAGTKRLAQKAIELIDMTKHHGSHPRMGAVDVVPFVPVTGVTIREAADIARDFGAYLGSLGVPVFYYEECATRPERRNLVAIRKGEYEALAEKMTRDEWKPDEGPHKFVPRSGATVTGVRFPLVAFNVNLATDDLAVGKQIVKAVRGVTGGYKNVRAIALPVGEKNMVQISMNLVQYQETPIHRVFETVKSEAAGHGVAVTDCELVGPVPLAAFEDVLKHYLRVQTFSMEQVY
jgi:glutamate formiminotransferase